MFHTVIRPHWNRVHLGVLISSVALMAVSAPASGGEKKPAAIDVVLPADAELEVDGYKAKARGPTRRFESPPVEVGMSYVYTFKATWRGHTIERTVRVRPEGTTTVDLRQELQTAATPAPVGSFSLLVPPAIILEAGREATLPLRVKRDHFPGSIRITFQQLSPGITIPDVTLAREQSETKAILTATADAWGGTEEINVVASSGTMRDTSTMEITVYKPIPKPEPKPEITPAPAPITKPTTKPDSHPEIKPERKPEPEARPATALQLVLPDRVELVAGRTRYVEVQVKMSDGSPLPGEPSVTMMGSGTGLRTVPWTASGFKAGQNVYMAGFAIAAEPVASADERGFKVTVVAGSSKAERTLKITVKPPLPRRTATPG